MALASVVGVIKPEFGSSSGIMVVGELLGLGMIVLLIAGGVLGVLGLIEWSRQREAFSRGRAQAIWALVLGGIMLLIFSAGLIKRANSLALGSRQSEAGKMVAFDNLNCQFQPPGPPWLQFDPSHFMNKSCRLGFMRRNPELYFVLSAERLGTGLPLTTEQFAEIGLANMRAVSGSCRVTRQAPWKVGALNGLLVETEAQVGSYQLHYRNWYYSTNGYAYLLIGYSRVEDQEYAARELQSVFSRFDLIDPNRVASNSGGFTNDYYSVAHNYAVVLTNSSWRAFATLEKDFPYAEFGASLGDSCLVVVPIYLKDDLIDLDALTAGFLATLNIAYPNEGLSNRKVLTESELHGQQFDFSREVNGISLHYRFKILQGDGEAYLLAARTQRSVDAEAVLADALGRVRFLSPATSSMQLWHRAGNTGKERKREAYVLNQVGLHYFKQNQFEKALPLFRASANAEEQSVYVLNALKAWQNLDRPTDALAFLDTLPSKVLSLPEVKADEAYFQAQASLIDQSITNYAQLFASGYRSDSHFTEYIELLAGERQYDAALNVVQDYLRAGDSVAVRLLEAQLQRLKQNVPKAISLLKDLRQQFPFNTKVATELAETLLAAGQFSESLELSRDLVAQNRESAPARYLEGRSELGLKWYREAKDSFADAVRLAPANKDFRAYLDYVSGMLGEGDNSAVRELIEPVAIPSVLTNAPAEPVPVDYAASFGAYYVRRIVAAAYTPGKEIRTTEYSLVKIVDVSGVSAFSTVQAVFDPLAEQVFVNELRVTGPDGKVLTVGDTANYYVLDDRTTTADSQKKVLNIPVAGLQPGCQLAFTITRQQVGHLEEFPFCAHSFSSSFPVRESLFFLHGDAHGLRYRTCPHLEPQKLPDGLCWRVTEPLVARREPLQPAPARFVPMLWISDASEQWRSIVSSYLSTISDRLATDPTVQSQAVTMLENLDNNDAKIACLTSYVQTNLIYKAIEFGRRARIPHAPAEIIRNKYGDCKDHAVLLQQLLLAAGIPAHLALVNHYAPVQKDLPSLDQFDHMIVYVPKGQTGQFLDCTSKGADVAHATPFSIAGQEALILDPADPHFVTVPQCPSDASRISVEERVRVVDQTDLAIEESLLMTGASAASMREYLLPISESNRRMMLQNIMGMADIDLRNLAIDSLNERSAPLRLRFSYLFRKQFRRSHNQIRGTLRAGFCRAYLSAIAVDNRLTPFEIKFPFSLDASVLIDPPTNTEAEPPDNLDLKFDPRFATGRGTAEIRAGKIALNLTLSQLPGDFKATDYEAYRQTMAQALSFLEREIVFKTPGD